MLAMYAEAPKMAEVCAIVDPVSNQGAWVRRDGRAVAFTYEDNGTIDYSRSVPRVVEILVENKTGRRIRFGCRG